MSDSNQFREDDYLKCELYSGIPDDSGFYKFENEGKFYFSFIENSKVILRSEGYGSESGRDNGIASVSKNMILEEQYVTKQLSDGHWVLSLKAANHQEIARSCGCASEAEAKAYLPSERKKHSDELLRLASVSTAAAAHAAGDKESTSSVNEEDDYMICREYEEKYEAGKADSNGMISFQHENTGKFYFAWVNAKGDVILRSEGYPTAGARDNGIDSVVKNREIPERFKVEEKRGVYYLVLKAGNHQEIGRSCPKNSEDELWALIKKEEAPAIAPAAIVAPVAAAAAAVVNTPAPAAKQPAEKDDDYLACADYKGFTVSDKANNIAFFKHNNGQFYFVVYHKDGSVRLRSEVFKTPQQRDQELKGVIKYLNDEKRYEHIEKSGYRIKVLKDTTGRELGRTCPEKIGATVASAPIVATVAAAAPVVASIAQEVKKEPVAPVTRPAPVVVDKPGFNWWWLLPLLLLIPLFFWWKSCNSAKVETATVSSQGTEVTTPVVADTLVKEEPVVAETAAPAKEVAPAPDCNLHWILFDFDKFNIRSDANNELQTMAKILKENPNYKGVLKAHTDARGTDQYNQVLSENRARAAKDVLVASGIDAGRIQTSASSESAPIAKNTDDDSGRHFNRRVELFVQDATGKEVCKSIPPAVPSELKGN